ncbi:MAG: DUF3048 domain-containing protein, partial [Bacteroidetes bacterium]|nr:DUF3048 domain-containing protein [Bacteroidota bacterium]
MSILIETSFKSGTLFINKPELNETDLPQWLHSSTEGNVFLFVLVSFLVAILFSAYFLFTEQTFTWEANIFHRLGPQSQRMLDGVLVPRSQSKLKPISIILENHVGSRPVSGLEFASIIYEIIVEGDITRFLAIFDNQIAAKKIGPVRSARPFFVDLVEEWNGILFHAGGSPVALAQLKSSQIFNLDEISADGIYFWRDLNRDPPHNLFTTSNLIQRAIEAKQIEINAEFIPWLFKNDSPVEGLVKDIEVNFSGNPLYQVSYR